MKKLTFYSIIIALAINSSCDTTGQIDCIRASSNIISETRDLKDFKGVIFNNWGEVYITQGPEYSFSIEGPDNVVELTTTEIEGEILIIGSEKCFNGDFDLTVEITAPDYKLLNLVGGGKIASEGNIHTDNIAVDVYGLGEIDVDIFADSIYTTIIGQANVSLGGIVTYHQLISSGLFTLNAYSLETDHTFINISGEGDCYVTAFDKLDVIIEGQGNIYYQGQPEIHSDITGIGEIIDSN